MRFPSVDRLITSARDTAASFPLVLGSAIVAVAAGIVAIDASDEDFWLRLLFAAALGLPLFFAMRMVSERRAWRPARLWAARLLGLALLAAFFLAWPEWSEPVRIERLLQAAIAFHLLAAFAPFIGASGQGGSVLGGNGGDAGIQGTFWEYNKTLFLRFLTAGLYSAVLFVGLAIALAGIDNLLGVNVDEDAYVRLWLLIAFVFNT
ncbi:MAG: hypothetical protein V3T25_02595, partial [Gemmatimonadota bacterium]